MSALAFKNTGLFAARPSVAAPSVARAVPVLSQNDVKALDAIRTSGLFTLEKSVGMYSGVKKLRPQK